MPAFSTNSLDDSIHNQVSFTQEVFIEHVLVPGADLGAGNKAVNKANPPHPKQKIHKKQERQVKSVEYLRERNTKEEN